MKNIPITLLILLSFNQIFSQKNILTNQEYSNIKVDNVLLEAIIDTNGNESQMQSLFGNILIVEKGFNDAVEHWIKFNTTNNSLCIEFQNGISAGVNIKYDLASIETENDSSSFYIKGKTITVGSNSSILSNSQVRSYQGKKMMIFSLEDFDSYIYFNIDPVSNIITKIGYNGNLF